MAELNGHIHLGIVGKGTSLKGCRINPVPKSLGEGRREEDAEITALPSLLALFKSNVSETLPLLYLGIWS